MTGATAIQFAQTGSALATRYGAALRTYCRDMEEEALVQSYEIAREALGLHLTVADYTTLHNGALKGLIKETDDYDSVFDTAEAFFLEGIAVFDMALRGYQGNISRLKTEIAERRRIEEELRNKTLDLARQRDDLDRQVQSRTKDIADRAAALEVANRNLIHANTEQAEFTYALSHDLKTPINTIDMFLETLLEDHADVIDGDAKELVEIAIGTAARMKVLIEDVLEYSHIVEHSSELAPVDLAEVVADILSDMAATITRSGATIQIAPLPVVMGNRFQLRILFSNLLSNAIKYQRADQTPEISVAVHAAACGEKVTIALSDNGIGIPENQQTTVFELFKRLHSFDQYRGSGIGLALCKRVADNHGFEIDLASEEGVGSEFRFDMEFPKG